MVLILDLSWSYPSWDLLRSTKPPAAVGTPSAAASADRPRDPGGDAASASWDLDAGKIPIPWWYSITNKTLKMDISMEIDLYSMDRKEIQYMIYRMPQFSYPDNKICPFPTGGRSSAFCIARIDYHCHAWCVCVPWPYWWQRPGMVKLKTARVVAK
jgi:hypothetical protein